MDLPVYLHVEISYDADFFNLRRKVFEKNQGESVSENLLFSVHTTYHLHKRRGIGSDRVLNLEHVAFHALFLLVNHTCIVFENREIHSSI